MRQRAAQMKASITEGYKRVAVHAEMIFGPLSMTLLMKCQSITERYRRVAAYGNSDRGSSPPQAGFFGRFHGSRTMILLDFDTIWHLEL